MIKKIKTLLFSNQTTRQTVAKNTFWLTFANIGGRLLRAGVVVYAARVLGATEWGVFSYALGLIGLLTILSDFGIGPLLTREKARGENKERTLALISTAFYIKTSIIVVSVATALIIAPKISNISGAETLLPIVLLIFAFDSFRQFGFSLIRAIEKMEWEAGLFLLTNFGILIFGIILLSTSPTSASFAWSYAIGAGIGTIATYISLRDMLRQTLTTFSSALMMPIFKAALPFAVASVMMGFLINLDIVIIGIFRGAEEVGYYAAATRIIQFLLTFPSIIAASMFPPLVRLVATDIARARSLLERTLVFLLMWAVPLGIGGMILTRELILLIFSDTYLPAATSLQILFLTLITSFPILALVNTVFAHGKQKALFIFSLIAISINIVLDVFLVPILGAPGAAIATLCSQIISGIYLFYVVREQAPMRVLARIKNISFSAITMTGICALLLVLHTPTLLVIVLAGIAYFGTLYAMREPILKDMLSIMRFSV